MSIVAIETSRLDWVTNCAEEEGFVKSDSVGDWTAEEAEEAHKAEDLNIGLLCSSSRDRVHGIA